MRRFLAAVVIFVTCFAFGSVAHGDPMQTYQTRYYVIHTDLDVDAAREAAIRMTKMAEEYHERTRDFSGGIRQKLPFFLFNDQITYREAGGMPGTAGVFTGSKLMACADGHIDPRLWHTIQHEGFHQFADAVIGGDLPIWVNEGMAEYFGEGVFTGDGFVTGVIPQSRLERVRKSLKANDFKSIRAMMELSHAEWNMEMSSENYDQGWMMVHFLAHGEDGKYQKAFSKFMLDIGKNKSWKNAWQDNFGDANGFEEKWKDYWEHLPDDPTIDLYGKSTLLTLTSYLARATSQKQTFDSFEAFQSAAKEEQLKSNPEDWLPPDLLTRTLELADKVGEWKLQDNGKKLPQLILTCKDGTVIVGSFTLKSNNTRISTVGADFDDVPKAIAEAKKLMDDGKRDLARTKLHDALRQHPNSPSASEAQKMMGQIR